MHVVEMTTLSVVWHHQAEGLAPVLVGFLVFGLVLSIGPLKKDLRAFKYLAAGFGCHWMVNTALATVNLIIMGANSKLHGSLPTTTGWQFFSWPANYWTVKFLEHTNIGRMMQNYTQLGVYIADAVLTELLKLGVFLLTTRVSVTRFKKDLFFFTSVTHPNVYVSLGFCLGLGRAIAYWFIASKPIAFMRQEGTEYFNCLKVVGCLNVLVDPFVSGIAAGLIARLVFVKNRSSVPTFKEVLSVLGIIIPFKLSSIAFSGPLFVLSANPYVANFPIVLVAIALYLALHIWLRLTAFNLEKAIESDEELYDGETPEEDADEGEADEGEPAHGLCS